MKNFGFANDVIIGLASDPLAPPVIPSLDLKAVARAVDGLLISEDALSDYQNYLMPRLSKLHAKAATAVGHGLSDDELLDRLAYLRPLAAEQEAFVLERPLVGRSDRELRDFRVDLLAVNLIALQNLQLQILNEAPLPWIDLMAEEGDRLRRMAAIPEPLTDWTQKAKEIGLEVAEANDFVVGSRGGSRVGNERGRDGAAADAKPASTHRLEPVHESAAADKLEWKVGRESAGSGVLTLDIERGASLVIKSGGLGFVEEGCTLTIRWLDPDGALLATGEAKDHDKPIVMTCAVGWMPFQLLEVTFVRHAHPERHFVARIEL